jgi:tripartite-type tricarboxylate transporter receptor subunit TctC
METVETTFTLTYSEEQYEKAMDYVRDMKKHPKRVFWLGKEGKSDEELIIGHIAHKILSGFYNNYDPSMARTQIRDMRNQRSA